MLTYGFYNSQNNDRVYDAEQFSAFLDGIVYDGVYSGIGNCFKVETTEIQNQLKVGPGRSWFNHTWTWNDTDYILSIDEGTIQEASPLGYRIDAVVIEVNKDERENYIKMVEGEVVSKNDYDAGERPVRPHLLGKKADGSKDISYDGNIFQYALAYIPRPIASEQSVIYESDIVRVVGDASGETPMCSALSLVGLPTGGRTGQILAKFSDESGNVGWYDPDKLPYEKWYLCDGITEDNVLAAYKFINRGSEEAALKNVNEKTSYILTKNSDNVTWNNQLGFYSPGRAGLDNSALRANGTNIKTVIIKYSDVTGSRGVVLSGGFGKDNSGGNMSSAIFARVPYGTNSYSYPSSSYIGFQAAQGSGHDTDGTFYAKRSSTTMAQEGVIGVTFLYESNTGSLYYNAELQAIQKVSDSQTLDYASAAGRVIGTSIAGSSTTYNSADRWSLSPFRVQYALFLNCELSAQQHHDLYAQIISDAG